MKQYRVKLIDERVIGPLNPDEVIELYKKSIINGDEMCQEFPVGDWLEINEYAEFDFPKREGSLYEIEKATLDKTTIQSVVKDDGKELEHTKINLDYKKYLEDEAKKKAQKDKELQKKKEIKQEIEIEVDYENEKTEVLNLKELESQLLKASKVEKIEEKVSRKRLKKQQAIQTKKNVTSEVSAEDNKKGTVSFLAIILAIICIAVVLDIEPEKKDDVLKPINVINPNIVFPSRYDVEDKSLAKDAYAKGIIELSKYNYASINLAAKYFSKSVINQFDDNKALAKLIFCYSVMLEQSKNFNEDAAKIFRLIQYIFSKSILEAEYTAAISTFYLAIDRHEAAALYIEKYLTVRGRQITPHLYANYLIALMRKGDFKKIKESQVLADLEKIESKDLYTLTQLYKYYQAIDEQDGKRKKIKEVVFKNYPNSVYFLLENAFEIVKSTDIRDDMGKPNAELINKVKQYVFKINSLNAEGSRSYYSEYLVLQGLIKSAENKVEVAAKYFEKSFDIFESRDLINRLSNLDETDNEAINNLIATSKLRKEMELARYHAKKGNYKSALNVALRARELDSNSIELNILLAKLSLKRGYVDDAVSKLRALWDQHSDNKKVLLEYISASIESYNFKETANLLTIATKFEGMREVDFYRLRAKLAKFQKKYASQSNWLLRAYELNPLDDELILEIANLYIRAFQYSKAKRMLNKGIELDPSNLNFRLSFARVLYEEETSNAAVGYLYDVLLDFPDNPKVLSEIGINYYKSGLIKKYKYIRNKLLSLPEKSESLYLFLIESARLDDDIEKMAKHAEALLYINPGNLKARLDLADNYIRLENYKKAKEHLDKLSKRLVAYPRLQYLYAKLYFLIKDFDKSKELVLQEIKANPTVVDGYLLMGKILKNEGKLEEAKKTFLKAVIIDGKNLEAILGIAEIEVENSQFEIALDQYQKAIEVDPTKAEVYRLIADTYKKLGQSQFAIKNYKQFLELSPNSSYKSSINNYIKTME